MLRLLLLACTLLSWCSADLTFGATNSMLDPNRITWWRSKWAPAPITLSRNNKSYSVAATFYVSPTTSIANGVFEVTFPAGFTLIQSANSQTINGQVLQLSGVTYVGGQDYAVTVVGITTPVTAGSYGPFAIRTRYGPLAQQVDVNLNFGSVFIYGDAGTLGSLTVSVVGAPLTGTIINRSGLTLSFKFTISVSLWRYDTFIILADSRWTIGSGALCSSFDSAGRWNNFNGTKSANPHSLQCVVTPPTTPLTLQSIYIYGLAVDGVDTAVTADNQYVDLRVTSVTSPNSVYSGNAYTWAVSTCRFGTTTFLETGTYTSGPLIVNDVITTATWAPTWGSPTSSMLTGQAAFFDLTFTVTNAIPLYSGNGYISVTFTEAISLFDNNWINGGVNCYIVTYLGNGVDCTMSLNTLTISGLPAIAAGTAIKVRSILTITSTSGVTCQITSINTFQGVGGSPTNPGYPIDIGMNLGAFTIPGPTSFLSAVSFSVGYHPPGAGNTPYTAAGGKYTAGVLEDYHLQFAIATPITTMTSNTQFTINCPFSSAIDDFSIGLPSPGNWMFASDSFPGFSVNPTTPANTSPIFTAGTSGTVLGSITFAGTILAAAPTFLTQQHLQVRTSSGSSFITLPRVANNYATAYECRVAITTPSLPTQTAFVRLAITPQNWRTAMISLACRSRAEGMPLFITIQPSIAIPASTATLNYYVELSFTSATVGLMSGLITTSVTAVGTSRDHDPMSKSVDYPFAKSGSVPTAAKMYTTSYFSTLSFAGVGLLAPTTNPITFYVPVGGFVLGAPIAGIISSVYFLASDPRYKYVTHQATTSSPILSNASTSTTWTGLTAVPLSNMGENGSAQSGLQINAFKVPQFGMTSLVWSYIVLPRGFTFPSGSGTIKNLAYNTNEGVTFSQAYWFSSPTSSFNFPGVLFSNSVSAGIFAPIPNISSVSTGTFSLSGFSLPLGSNAILDILFYSGSSSSSDCESTGSIQFNSISGAISGLSVSPNTLKQRGPDGVNISHTVSFTLKHGIPAGGIITLVFNSVWGNPATSCSGCSVTGLTAATLKGSVSCTLALHIVTVSNFAEITTASSVITITVFGLLAPISVTNNNYLFVAALTSSINSYVIDSLPSVSSNNEVSVIAGSATGSPIWSAKKTYPSTVGASYVDLHLKFSMPHSLPACGTIAISSPLLLKQSGDVKNFCFFSPLQYSSCNVSGSVITLTLAQSYTANSILELYMDAMADNPTTAAATSTSFVLTASWGDVTVDVDNGSLQTAQTFAASSTLSTLITPSSTSSLAFSPKTSGEVATYVFDFKDTANFTVTDQYWIVFPSQYDYFLGDVWTWFSNEPSVYYIECASIQLGTTWCQVDHNTVLVSGSNVVNGGTQIVITINSVVNPIAGITSAFQIYHLDVNGSFITVNQNYGTVTLTAAAANNIGVRSLVMSENRLFKSSDYTWRLYLTDTMNTDSQLQVLFPREYNLRLLDKKDSYSCSSTWLDISSTATIKAQQNWNSLTSCNANGNLVTLGAPSTSITFSNTNVVTFAVQSVSNPQYGLSRSALTITQDFDVTDSVLWPLWAYWVSKYTFFVYRTSPTNLIYTSRSYPNMNSAYANLYDGYRPLLVNGYNPQFRTNRIVVYAGTQSNDVLITTASTGLPMAAKQIVLTPTSNSKTPDGGRLKYTSAQDGWTLLQSYYSIKFRVCAAIDTTKGLYYIDWSNNETKQTGLNDVQYDIPASTLVEVVGKTSGKYTFDIAPIPNVSTGITTVPIKVTISNAPCTDVNVNVSVSGAPANISVTPASLTFSPDVNVRYFQILVASNYDMTLGNVQTLLFALTGSDAYAYAIAASTKFTITQSSTTQTPGNVVSWGLGLFTRTTIIISPSSDQIGVIYYQFAAVGNAVPSFSALKSSLPSLISLNGTSGTGENNNGADSQTDPQTGENWEGFQRRLYKQHLQTQWTGAIAMSTISAVTSLSFTWLWAATTYQLVGYLDNLSTITTPPIVKIETFTTLAMADSQPVSLKFTGQVLQSLSSKVAANYASVIGVNPSRLAYPTYTTSPNRVLQGGITTVAYTTFSYTLLVNRFSESPSPTDQAKVTGTALTALSNLLVADGLTNTLNSVANNAVPSRVAPSWTLIPANGGSTIDSVTVNLRSSTAGRSCCVALLSSSTPPTAEQIILGLDSTNTVAPGLCVDTDLTASSNSLQISSLQESTAYYVYCSATDNYPLWPTYMSYSSTSPITPVDITTLTNTTIVETGASCLGGLLVLFFH